MTQRIFTYTGAVEDWVVPAGVTSITFDVQGGSGHGYQASVEGKGGQATGVLAVTAGETLHFYVGPWGGTGATFQGGGAFGSGNGEGLNGYRGGGRSEIRQGGTTFRTHTQVVAGGGGGSGGSGNGFGAGGSGGGTSGGPGASVGGGGTGGGGGTQAAGGAAGTNSGGGTAPEAGETDGDGEGGDGGSAGTTDYSGGGGGGGGYYGGGGGGAGSNGAGGGGGSGYIGGSNVSGAVLTNGVRSGAGIITITYSPVLVITVTTPTDGATLTDPDVPVAWTITNGSGVQNDYRIRVYETDTNELIYDSGQIASGTPSATIPGTALENGTDYYFTVEVHDTDGNTGISGQVDFTTNWPAPADIVQDDTEPHSDERDVQRW